MGKLQTLIRKVITIRQEKILQPIPHIVFSEAMLEGKSALITGGGSGIGFAIAQAFLQNKCEVIISGRNEEKLVKAIDTLHCYGKVHYIVLDISNVEEMDKKLDEAIGRLENKKLDILVNSAGLMAKSQFWDMSEAEYDNVLDTNLKGTYFISQKVSKKMVENSVKGHILNISSASSLRPAWSPYQISKWGITGLTKGLADILIPYGITVNAIAPGPTATPMLNKYDEDNLFHSHNPAGRYAQPEEIAYLAVYLSSTMGDLIVGDTIYISGGGGTISLHR